LSGIIAVITLDQSTLKVSAAKLIWLLAPLLVLLKQRGGS
jgi:hypothetical protein